MHSSHGVRSVDSGAYNAEVGNYGRGVSWFLPGVVPAKRQSESHANIQSFFRDESPVCADDVARGISQCFGGEHEHLAIKLTRMIHHAVYHYDIKIIM